MKKLKLLRRQRRGSSYEYSTDKHDFMHSCFNHPIISDLIKFE